MPAVALVGAAASVSMGVTAMAAATTIGASLAAGAMIAGGVLTGLGTLTGNKKLARIGAVLSIGGGIGTAMSGGASAAGGTASIGGEGVSMGTAAGNAGSNAAEFGMAELGNVADTAGVVVNPIAPSGIVAQEIGAPMGNGAFLGEYGDLASGAAQPGPAMGSAPASTEQAAAMQKQLAYVSDSDGLGQILGPDGKSLLNTSNPMAEKTSSLKNWASDAWDFVRKPENAQLVKAGSGLVQGAMGAYSQQSMIDQQLAAREAERQRFNRSIIGQYVTR